MSVAVSREEYLGLERRVARLEAAITSIEQIDSNVGDMKNVIMGPKDSLVTRLSLIERDVDSMRNTQAAETSGKYQIMATMISSILALVGVIIVGVLSYPG